MSRPPRQRTAASARVRGNCLPGGDDIAPEAVADPLRNTLVRRVDWRFLLRQREVPRAVDLTADRHSEALQLVCETAPDTPASADLVVLGHPSGARLTKARELVRPGGEVVCQWRVPLPGGVLRVRRRLERAGFTDVRVHWPGPLPERATHFWLPPDRQAAADYVMGLNPAASPAKGALRQLWRASASVGLLAPLFAVARAPGPAEAADEVGALVPAGSSWLLLTGGHSITNKVVGLPFAAGQDEPSVVVKFARVPEGEGALRREAAALRALERERPGLTGVPRLAATGRRVGRSALAQSPVHGWPMYTVLTPENFAELAQRVTHWLVELAGRGPAQGAAGWWQRLVGEPLEGFERAFGSAVRPGTVERARERLEGLGELPQAFEHRDCAPWNVVLTDEGGVGVLDWESAEPRGLPACDLIYFLTTAAFVLEDSLESGRTRETYSRLLDPSTPCGRVAASCLEEYRARLGLDRDDVRRLRLLCWILRNRSDHSGHDLLSGDARRPTMEKVSLGLLEEELKQA